MSMPCLLLTDSPLIMSIPISSLSKFLLAQGALEWQFLRVDPYMVPQVAKLWECQLTGFALKKLVHAVGFRVFTMEEPVCIHVYRLLLLLSLYLFRPFLFLGC